MCGRYAAFLPPEAIIALFEIRGETPNWPPTWNMAPTRDAPVVRLHPQTGERRLDLLRWGLLPHWAKDPKATRQPINARAETLASSAMFRDAFARRRCLVPADAFYEWMTPDAGPPDGGTLLPPRAEARDRIAAGTGGADEASLLTTLFHPRNDGAQAAGDPRATGDAPTPDQKPAAGAATATDEHALAADRAPPVQLHPPARSRRAAPRSAKPASPAKQPWAIAREDGQPLVFAGLWEGWRGSDGSVVRSYTIVTTGANATLRPLHERMPVVLEPTDWPLWLGETEGDPAPLLRPSAAGFRIWPVGQAVNNVRNDSAALLQAD